MRWRTLVADVWVVDGLLAVALTVLAQAQVPVDVPIWMRTALVVTTGALAWRRHRPLVVTTAVAASVALMAFSSEPPSVFGEYLAVMLAAYTVAERRALAAAAAGLVILIAGIVVHDWRSSEFGGLSGFLSDSAVPVVIWLVGRAVHIQRSRAERSQDTIRTLESERNHLAKSAVAAERLRLARELHDIVTHSLSVMVIQAQGAQQVLERDPDEVRCALRVIESAGRETLGEMRRLLGLLRDEASGPPLPQPRIGDLDRLVDKVRRAGLQVKLAVDGQPGSLDPGLELTVYRIVQESLTNSLKYARPGPAAVRISWTADAVELSVTDTGGGSGAGGGGGRGLLGMRERVLSIGGQLEAGPVDRGFRVQARLPVRYSA